MKRLDCKPAAGLAGFVILHARNFWAKCDESVYVLPADISKVNRCVVLHERLLLYAVKNKSIAFSQIMAENASSRTCTFASLIRAPKTTKNPTVVFSYSLVRQICLLGVFRFCLRLVIPFSKKTHIISNILIHRFKNQIANARSRPRFVHKTPRHYPHRSFVQFSGAANWFAWQFAV